MGAAVGPASHELPGRRVAEIRRPALSQQVVRLSGFQLAGARADGPDVPTSPHAVGRRVRRVEETHFE